VRAADAQRWALLESTLQPYKNMESLRKTYHWTDPNEYQWVLYDSTRHILSRVGPVIGLALIIPAISYVLTVVLILLLAMIYSVLVSVIGVARFGGEDRMAANFKLWSGIAITIVLIAATAYFFWLIFWLMWKGSSKKRVQAQSNLHELLTTSIGIMACVMSNLTTSGFSGSVDSFIQWLRFFGDNAFRAVLLDIPEVFDVRLSDIEPHAWFARLGTVFFRFLIAAGLVDMLWVVYRRMFGREVVSGTVKDLFWKCQNLLDRDILLLKREGKIDFSKSSEPAIRVVDFVEALDEDDYRDGRAD